MKSDSLRRQIKHVTVFTQLKNSITYKIIKTELAGRVVRMRAIRKEYEILLKLNTQFSQRVATNSQLYRLELPIFRDEMS